jgi:hypothetical protein
MYQLTRALAKTLSDRGRWVEVEIGDKSFVEIYATYFAVKAILTNDFIDHEVCLDLADVRSANIVNGASLNQWLLSISNATLPTTDQIPIIKERFARYSDATRAKYKITPASPNINPGSPTLPSERTALYVSKEGLDFNLFKKHCLVSVNGFYHFADTGANGSLIVDGGKTMRRSNQAVMGILSFQDIGEIHTIPIRPSMVYKQSDEQKYNHRVNVDVGEDISQKTIILILGGYMHLLDHKTFYRVGERTIAIDFENLHFFERYHESMKYMDLSALPIQRTDLNPTQIGVEDFLSDENIMAYMTLSQSFVVVLDTPDIYTDKVHLRPAPFPNSLISYSDPIYPLFNGLGKTAEYWTTYEDKQWSLTVIDNWQHKRVYNTVDPYVQQSFGDSRRPYDPVSISDAYMLKIGTNAAFKEVEVNPVTGLPD